MRSVADGRAHKRRLLMFVLLALLVGAACISTASAATGVAHTHRAAADSSLTVAVATVGPEFAPIYIAQALGYFDRDGITLLPGTGSNTLSLVIAGNADLMFQGAATAVVAAAQGKPVQCIWKTNHAGSASFVAVAASQAASVKSYKDLAGMRVGTLGTSGETYGSALKLAKIAGISINLIPFASQPALSAALDSGNIAAAVGVKGWFLPSIESGHAKTLINPEIPAVRKALGFERQSGGALMGLRDNLKAKRSIVIQFLSDAYNGERYVFTHSDAQVANLLSTVSSFQGYDRSLMLAGIAYQRKFWAWDVRNLYTSSGWSTALQEFADYYNLPGFSPTSPVFTYDNMVDMSYLSAALPKPVRVDATVAADGRLTVSAARSIPAGEVIITVNDQSTKSGFVLGNQRLTTKRFTGKKVVTLTLSQGHDVYFSDAHPQSKAFLSVFYKP
jgi:ABC-type nitrate/sulfonate/bicarbonate transport system substrate-binding protein